MAATMSVGLNPASYEKDSASFSIAAAVPSRKVVNARMKVAVAPRYAVKSSVVNGFSVISMFSKRERSVSSRSSDCLKRGLQSANLGQLSLRRSHRLKGSDGRCHIGSEPLYVPNEL